MTLTYNDLAIVSEAANIYANELLGRSLIILYRDSSTSVDSYTVHFTEKNFMHLTGIRHIRIKRYNTSRFFHLALEKRLNIEEFEMTDRHTTRRKLDVLTYTLRNTLHAYMIGTYNNSGQFLVTDRVVGNVCSCIGFMPDENNGLNYPNTLLNTDVRQMLRYKYRVCAIFRKQDDEESYSEATYVANDVPWKIIQFPTELQYLKGIVLSSKSK